MIKKYALLFFSVLSFAFADAQSTNPQVISSGGNFISSASGSISYTIGEAVTPTLAGGGHILTQGFQQPTDIISGLLDIDREAFGSFSVYPIPAIDRLWFGYEYPTQGSVEVSLYNSLGQKLNYTLTEAYDAGKVVHSFDCTPYVAGQYILSATFTGTDGTQQILSKQFLIIN